MRFILRWILLAISVLLAGRITSAMGLDFSVQVDTTAQWMRLFFGVAILALLNNTVGPILKLLTLPISCLTFGLFSLVINAAILYAVGQIGEGFRIGNFWTAFVGSLLISAFNGILGGLILKDKSD